MIGRIGDWLEKFISPASRIAHNIGISMIVVLTALTVVNVLMRFIVGSAFTPTKELSEYALSILVFLAFPYCAVRGSHIVVDLFTMRMSRRSQAILGIIIYLISIITCGLFTWQMVLRGIRAMDSGEESTILGVWLFPFVFIAAIGFLMLGIAFLMHWFRALQEAQK